MTRFAPATVGIMSPLALVRLMNAMRWVGNAASSRAKSVASRSGPGMLMRVSGPSPAPWPISTRTNCDDGSAFAAIERIAFSTFGLVESPRKRGAWATLSAPNQKIFESGTPSRSWSAPASPLASATNSALYFASPPSPVTMTTRVCASRAHTAGAVSKSAPDKNRSALTRAPATCDSPTPPRAGTRAT